MSWAAIPLHQVAKLESGFGFPREHQGDEKQEFPFFRVSDMNLPGNEVFMENHSNTVSASVLRELGARAFPPGTVIFPKIGAAIGTEKKRILARPATYDNNVMGAVPGKAIHPKFLYYWFLQLKLADYANPGHVPSIRKSVMADIPFPWLASSEQLRIVEMLDEAERLRRLRRKADAKAARILPALFLHMFGAPDQWKAPEPLGQLVLIKSGGTPSKSVAEFWRGTIPWVSPKDMKRDEIEDAEDHVSESAIAQTAVQMVPTDSVLIVVRGMILARDVPVAIARRPVTINQDMKALVLTDKRLDTLYLFAALKVQAARLLAEVTTAAHGTKKLETTRLASLPVRIPAPAELQAFSSAYRQLLAVDRLRAAASPRIDSLFSLLLQRAFSGQLTAKWREPCMKELLAEMAQQARVLNLPTPTFADA